MKRSPRIAWLALLVLILATALQSCSEPGNEASASPQGTDAAPARGSHGTDSGMAAVTPREAPDRAEAPKKVSAPVMESPKTPAPTAIPGGGVPSILFKEMRFHFGTIYEGEKIQHQFELTNEGDAPLVISKVKSSCGCTVANRPEEPIAPGASASINVEFDSKRRSGSQKKDVSVFSNDPERPMLKLKIEGDVLKQFWIEPKSIYLGNVTMAQTLPEKKVRIRWNEGVDVNITELIPSTPAITVDRAPFEDNESVGLELTVQFGDVPSLVKRRKGGDATRIAQNIKIVTEGGKFDETLTISASIIPEVTVRPRVLSFGVTGKDSKPTVKKIIVTAAKNFDLAPPTIDSKIPFLSVDVKEVRAGKQYEVLATMNPAAAPEGQFRDDLTLLTNSKEFGAITIPVFGKIRP